MDRGSYFITNVHSQSSPSYVIVKTRSVQITRRYKSSLKGDNQVRSSTGEGEWAGQKLSPTFYSRRAALLLSLFTAMCLTTDQVMR